MVKMEKMRTTMKTIPIIMRIIDHISQHRQCCTFFKLVELLSMENAHFGLVFRGFTHFLVYFKYCGGVPKFTKMRYICHI